MEQSTKKRLIIGLVYLVFFASIFWFLHSIFAPKPTCTDGIKNQNEQGVDCGGVCSVGCQKIEAKDLTAGETGIVETSVAGEYDFYGMVINPNNVYGGKFFSYDIKFKDETGAILAEKQGENFILPGDRKYVIENNIKLSKLPTSIDFSVSNPVWVELDDLYEKPDLKIVNKKYAEIGSGIGFSEAKGLLQNNSPFDFALIQIKIILRDAAGKIIALNATEMRTVKSKEDRDFRVFWPNRFLGVVSNVETQVDVNIFDSESFARQYFKSEQFQAR